MLGLSKWIMIPVKANTELVMFKPRLLRTKPFVVLLPATIENEPEIINMRDPQTGYPMYTETGGISLDVAVALIIMIPMVRFMRAITICTTPRILGSPFKNFSAILFHACEFTCKDCCPSCCAS